MSQELTVQEGFEVELQTREQEIFSLLPPHIDPARFKSSILAAAKQTPDLLQASPRTFFAAIAKSAQDGLLPDGREGVILAYKGEAQWQPMTFGMRKRARELDGIIVDAQIVYEHDKFFRGQGDAPTLTHTPAALGVDRGKMIGAYAIYRKGETILHREVMDAAAIETVKSQSRQPNGLLWGKFVTEAWRKTVVKRGFKTVPCSEQLQSVVRRDDENYQFDQPAVDAPPRPERVEYQPTPPAQGEDFDEQYRQTMGAMSGAPEPASGETDEGDHVGKEFGLPATDAEDIMQRRLDWLKETSAKAQSHDALEKWIAKESTQRVLEMLPNDMLEDWAAHIAGVREVLDNVA